jgi:hypothetical protein
MLLCCAALAAFPLPVWAEQPAAPAEMVIRLTVQPMAAPKPALRYLLLPELKEMTPGNPIPNYLKCLLDKGSFPDRETVGRAALRLADRAARMDKPDWQILLKVKTDGIGLLLPDLQKTRELANALQMRFHDEASQRHFDDALVTAKTMFALSRHVGEHPTLIGNLVGIAIAFVTIAPLEEMLQQPGCPNLYWALTNLPSPLVSNDTGLEGERALILSEFKDLNPKAPMSAEELKKVLFHVDNLRRIGSGKKPGEDAREWLDKRTKDPELVRAARGRLIEVGYEEGLVARFPADQVFLLDQWREFEVRRDEGMKFMKLPTWQVEALFAKMEPPKEKALFDDLQSALIKVRRAQGRLEQRIALLRHVEALRLYAAEHDGKWPEKLADVSVPLPDDPFTGKPFRYQLDGATAHLRGSPPPGEEKNPAYNVHYEIVIQR